MRRYEGQFEEGEPHGRGAFRFRDERRFFDGNRTR